MSSRQPAALEIRGLEVVYQRRDGALVHAVAGCDLDVDAGEIVGLVGETGCGKSSLARAAVGLERPRAGTVRFQGEPVLPLSNRARPRRLAGLQMVFQNPYASLNPRRRVGAQLRDGLALADPGARRTPGQLLEAVGLPAGAARRFPHQFSGGQRQRIAIARALASNPRVIVLDEPLSALDASVQAQVANLLQELARTLGIGMLLISHDLAIVRQIAVRTAVMYLGRIVELAATGPLWTTPTHPYTEGLIEAIPLADGSGTLPTPPQGEIPDPAHPPDGCRFHPRCPYVMERCGVESPPFDALADGRHVACWLHRAGGEAVRPRDLRAQRATAGSR